MHSYCIFGLNEYHFSESMWNENTNIENFSIWISKLLMEKALMFSHCSAVSCKVCVSNCSIYRSFLHTNSQPQHKLSFWLLAAVWVRCRMLQERSISTSLIPGKHLLSGHIVHSSEEKFLLVLPVLQGKLIPVICSEQITGINFSFLHDAQQGQPPKLQ